MTLHNKNDYMMFGSHGLTVLAGQPALFVSVRVFISPSASISPWVYVFKEVHTSGSKYHKASEQE